VLDVREIVDLGGGVVFAWYDFAGPPKGSTADVRARMALVYEWVDGAVAHV
jgi:hypothetical protein